MSPVHHGYDDLRADTGRRVANASCANEHHDGSVRHRRNDGGYVRPSASRYPSAAAVGRSAR